MVHLFDLEPDAGRPAAARASAQPSTSRTTSSCSATPRSRGAAAGSCAAAASSGETVQSVSTGSWPGPASPGARRRRRAAHRAPHAVERRAHRPHAHGRLRPGVARRGQGAQDGVRQHGQRRRARRCAPARCAATSPATATLPDEPLLAVCPVSVRADDDDDAPRQQGVGHVHLAGHRHRRPGRAPPGHPRRARRAPRRSTRRSAPTCSRTGPSSPRPTRSTWRRGSTPACGLADSHRPIHNVIISNVPGPALPAVLRRRRAGRGLPDGPGHGGRGSQHHGDELPGLGRLRLHGRPRAGARRVGPWPTGSRPALEELQAAAGPRPSRTTDRVVAERRATADPPPTAPPANVAPHAARTST